MSLESIARHVYDTLGHGFSEAVYHRAFEVMLRKNGIQYQTERIVPILFEDHVIGNFRCDLIIDDTIVELKSIAKLKDQEKTQLTNYLKMSGFKKGLLINFGPSFEVIELDQ
jgi:GxxExxY protein